MKRETLLLDTLIPRRRLKEQDTLGEPDDRPALECWMPGEEACSVLMMDVRL